MIDNIAVGPPLNGAPGLQLRDANATKDSRVDSTAKSFSQALEGKMKTPENKPREAERKPSKELVQKDKDAPPGQKRAKGAREKAIKEFMDSFESEFRIPPTRIVEAMASIEPQKMNISPEESATAVVDHLDLAKEDREKAMAMYAGLLAGLQQIDHAAAKPNPLDNVLMMPQQIREQALQAQGQPRAVLYQPENGGKPVILSEDKGVVGIQALTAEQLQALEQSEAEVPAEGLEKAPMMDNAKPAAEIAAGAAALNEASKSQAQISPNVDRMKNVLAQMKMQADEVKISEALSKSGMASANVSMSAAKADQGAAMAANMQIKQDQTAVNAAAVSAMAAAAMKANADKGLSEQNLGDRDGESASEHDGGSGKGTGDLSMIAGSVTPKPLNMDDVAAALKAGPLVAAPIVMGKEDNEGNIRQIMSQAQYLIKRGGGEVKVQMSPEGLGQVNLKVMVQDGRVNVEMMAQSNEAKKAIESSLAELKTGLAAHKLSVEHVKVDVVAGTNTDNQTRSDNSSMNQDSQRQTQQFWNQFHDNFGNGRRDSIWDMQSTKKYQKSAAGPEPLQPIEAQSVQTRSVAGKGKSLNMVA